jgi:hypothetical protein
LKILFKYSNANGKFEFAAQLPYWLFLWLIVNL